MFVGDFMIDGGIFEGEKIENKLNYMILSIEIVL